MNPEADPDVQLMLAVRGGDDAAFEHLFNKYIGAVVAFSAQFVGSRARAEELAQDVFLRLYQTRGRYIPTARFATWLYRMATNACLSETRRADFRARPQSIHPVEDGEDERPGIEIPTISTEEEAAGIEALSQARAVIARLPAQQRAALLLARAEGFSYEEVAESLECSVPAVKSLIHRATLTLRAEVGEEH